MYQTAVAGLRDAIGQENYIVAIAQSGLALCQFLAGDRDAGETLSAHALEVAEHSTTAPTPEDQLAHIRFVHGHILQTTGRAAAARPLLEQAWSGYYNVAGPTFPWRATLLGDLIGACEAQGDMAAAGTWRTELARDIQAGALPPSASAK